MTRTKLTNRLEELLGRQKSALLPTAMLTTRAESERAASQLGGHAREFEPGEWVVDIDGPQGCLIEVQHPYIYVYESRAAFDDYDDPVETLLLS
jgi:hypothetical protein